MATIYQRGRCWYLNWSDPAGQHRKSLGPVTAHDAETARRGKEYELATGRRLFIASPLFDDFLTEYLDWHRADFPSSHARVAQIAEQHFEDFRGKSLAEIQNTDVERWKAQRAQAMRPGKGKVPQLMTASSIEKELRTLSAVFAKAIEWGKLDGRNPCAGVDPPQNLESAPIHWYTRAQLAKLYRGWHGQTWKLMANTGLRRSEARQLRPEDIDFRRGVIRVVSTAGARTKSGKWREVPLNDSARVAARALIRANGESGYVVPRITRDSLSRSFSLELKRLGLEGSLHGLRHSYGAHLVMAGVPLRTLQVLMGHASFTTTEKYAHVGRDHLRAKARRVNL